VQRTQVFGGAEEIRRAANAKNKAANEILLEANAKSKEANKKLKQAEEMTTLANARVAKSAKFTLNLDSKIGEYESDIVKLKNYITKRTLKYSELQRLIAQIIPGDNASSAD
jgi:septation ring formation regulator EzrA